MAKSTRPRGAPPSLPYEPDGSGCGDSSGNGGESWSVLAEWAGPETALCPALPPHQPHAAAAADAAGAALATATAAAAAHVPAGVAACSGQGVAARRDSDLDPFHDDWHAW